MQCAQNTKQFTSVDSTSWAEQNGANDFIVACTVVEILLSAFRPLEAKVLWFLWTNISTTEHHATIFITPFHPQSTTQSNDINISYYEKIPKIGENPLIIDLAFHQNFAIFTMCSKH